MDHTLCRAAVINTSLASPAHGNEGYLGGVLRYISLDEDREGLSCSTR